MQTKLCPCCDLKELIEGAKAARKGDEAIGEIGHESFAFVHTAYFVQGSQVLMSDFATKQGTGYDANDFAAPGQYSIGNDSHQSDAGTSVNQPKAPYNELLP
jgi:hypothetical protein